MIKNVNVTSYDVKQMINKDVYPKLDILFKISIYSITNNNLL